MSVGEGKFVLKFVCFESQKKRKKLWKTYENQKEEEKKEKEWK